MKPFFGNFEVGNPFSLNTVAQVALVPNLWTAAVMDFHNLFFVEVTFRLFIGISIGLVENF